MVSVGLVLFLACRFACEAKREIGEGHAELVYHHTLNIDANPHHQGDPSNEVDEFDRSLISDSAKAEKTESSLISDSNNEDEVKSSLDSDFNEVDEVESSVDLDSNEDEFLDSEDKPENVSDESEEENDASDESDDSTMASKKDNVAAADVMEVTSPHALHRLRSPYEVALQTGEKADSSQDSPILAKELYANAINAGVLMSAEDVVAPLSSVLENTVYSSPLQRFSNPIIPNLAPLKGCKVWRAGATEDETRYFTITEVSETTVKATYHEKSYVFQICLGQTFCGKLKSGKDLLWAVAKGDSIIDGTTVLKIEFKQGSPNRIHFIAKGNLGFKTLVASCIPENKVANVKLKKLAKKLAKRKKGTKRKKKHKIPSKKVAPPDLAQLEDCTFQGKTSTVFTITEVDGEKTLKATYGDKPFEFQINNRSPRNLKAYTKVDQQTGKTTSLEITFRDGKPTRFIVNGDAEFSTTATSCPHASS